MPINPYPPKEIDLNNITVTTAKLYINEDLTRTRASLLYKARMGAKDGKISDCWSFDGVIRIKDLHNNIHRVTTLQQLQAYVPPTTA